MLTLEQFAIMTSIHLNPKPCITRHIISIVKLVLKPHIKLPILNKSNPAIAT